MTASISDIKSKLQAAESALSALAPVPDAASRIATLQADADRATAEASNFDTTYDDRAALFSNKWNWSAYMNSFPIPGYASEFRAFFDSTHPTLTDAALTQSLTTAQGRITAARAAYDEARKAVNTDARALLASATKLRASIVTLWRKCQSLDPSIGSI